MIKELMEKVENGDYDDNELIDLVIHHDKENKILEEENKKLLKENNELKKENQKYKEVIDRANNKLNNMFNEGNENKVLDDLLELAKILEVE